MMVKTIKANSTMTPKKSSMKATHDHWSRTGIEKFGLIKAP